MLSLPDPTSQLDTAKLYVVLAVGGDSVGTPRWNFDGSQLHYLSPDDAMMTVSVQTVPKIEVGDPKQLFYGR